MVTPSAPEEHVADCHDLIRVHGGRENNLKDIQRRDPEAPANRVHQGVRIGQEPPGVRHDRRGVAAAGQRCLQRLRAGLHAGAGPARRGPARRADDGDHRRPGAGANPRSTVGTVTDANAMLRILFSRLGQPHIGSPDAYSFNVPSVKASGAITVERGPGRTKARKATYNVLGGMCARCEGRGSVSDVDLSALYDDGLSLNEGALTIPGYSRHGWYGRIFRGCGFFDPDKPIRRYTKKELYDLLHKEPTKIKVDGINLTYEG